MAGTKKVEEPKNVDISEEPDSPPRARERDFLFSPAGGIREVNWEHVLFERPTDEILNLACILLNQAWPEGAVFGPQAFATWLKDFLRVLEAATDASELSKLKRKLKRHRLSAALLDNKDVVVALYHCKWTREQLEDNTTGAERVRGFADHYSALKICPQSRTVYHYNSITGYVYGNS